MNALDLILLFVIVVCVAISFRRGLIRVLISILGMYVTVLVAGYLYDTIGWTLSDAFGLSLTSMHNFAYLLVVVVVTVVVEILSIAVFEDTRILSLRKLDNLLGGLVGIFYGVLWAAILLVMIKYGVGRTGGTWTDFVLTSTLLPDINNIFDMTVLDIVRPLFLGDFPIIYQY